MRQYVYVLNTFMLGVTVGVVLHRGGFDGPLAVATALLLVAGPVSLCVYLHTARSRAEAG